MLGGQIEHDEKRVKNVLPLAVSKEIYLASVNKK